MGKVTGFKEFDRVGENHLAPKERVKNYREFTLTLEDGAAKVQGARCMECGVAYCNHACPLANLIPDFNDQVYRGLNKEALERLHATNNFPEFTGRVCPALCESACSLGLIADSVGIRSIERYIIEKGWENGWVKPEPNPNKTGKRVAVVGSGPAGLTAAQQLVRQGHDVHVYEKNDRIGGLLRYGIPGFKLEKTVLDRRLALLEAEGVVFHPGVLVGSQLPEAIQDGSKENVSAEELKAQYDAVVLAVGAEMPRGLDDVPGARLQGVHYAMAYLTAQNRKDAGERGKNKLDAQGKRVVIIGGGDTGSDCVGIANRQGAASILQFDRNQRLPDTVNKAMTWPYWPRVHHDSSSHEEGCTRDYGVMAKRLAGRRGKVEKIVACRVQKEAGRYVEIQGSEFEIPADMVILAMGFSGPASSVLEAFGVEASRTGAIDAPEEGARRYLTSVDGVFAAGDARRGQSLVVWAIHEGRACADAVDAWLMRG
ncbi:MAG: glutamate synthase subunit beta [Oxalobacter sp.]|nr:glutamate synthase subunit beta [Oxalobacter sp.]